MIGRFSMGFSSIFDALNFGTFWGQMFSFICFPCPKLGLFFWELKTQADGISDDWSVFGAFYGPVKTCKYRDAIRIQTPTNRTSQNHR